MMTNRPSVRLWTELAALFVLITFASCAPYVPPSNSSSTPPLEESNPVIYKDLTLKLYVHIRDVRIESANGLLIGKLTLENKKGSDLQIQIKAKWLDKDGYEVQDSWGMRPLMLKANETSSQQFIAPSPAAVSVRYIVSLLE